MRIDEKRCQISQLTAEEGTFYGFFAGEHEMFATCSKRDCMIDLFCLLKLRLQDDTTIPTMWGLQNTLSGPFISVSYPWDDGIIHVKITLSYKALLSDGEIRCAWLYLILRVHYCQVLEDIQWCEKVFAPLQISFVFAFLSHLNISDHQTIFYIRQR